MECCILGTDESESFGDGSGGGGGGGGGIGGGAKGFTTIRGSARELPDAIVVFFLRRFTCCRRACLMTFLLCTIPEYPEQPGFVSPAPSTLFVSTSRSMVKQHSTAIHRFIGYAFSQSFRNKRNETTYTGHQKYLLTIHTEQVSRVPL